jgi:small-conductance mechanosensitive channel
MSNIWDLIAQSFTDYWQNTLAQAVAPFLSHVIVAVGIALLTLAVARFTSRGVQRATQQATKDAPLALFLGRLVHLGVSGLGAGWILSVLGVPFAALAGFFGFFALGLSVSFADVLKSLIAGVYLLVERPFWVGDMISVKGMEGTVQEMRLRTTRLLAADGRTIIVPNSIILTEATICGQVAAPEGSVPSTEC